MLIPIITKLNTPLPTGLNWAHGNYEKQYHALTSPLWERQSLGGLPDW
jgi:hypothetical protein